jgi:hypothetical protein
MKFPSLSKFLIFLFFMVVSCSKDEPTPAERLVGNWSTGTVTLNIKVGDMTLNQYLVSTGVSATEAILYTALINSTMQSYFTGELQVNADKTFTFKTTSSTTTATGTWSIDDEGKELTLSSSVGLGGVFEITEFTATKLNLHSLQNLDPATFGYALPSSLTIDLTLIFFKE